MKGNEARIIFFLHPVKKVKRGLQTKKNPITLPSLRSILLILGTILGLGVTAFVLYRFTNKQFMLLDVSSTTVHPFTTATTGLPYSLTTLTTEETPTPGSSKHLF